MHGLAYSTWKIGLPIYLVAPLVNLTDILPNSSKATVSTAAAVKCLWLTKYDLLVGWVKHCSFRHLWGDSQFPFQDASFSSPWLSTKWCSSYSRSDWRLALYGVIILTTGHQYGDYCWCVLIVCKQDAKYNSSTHAMQHVNSPSHNLSERVCCSCWIAELSGIY